MSLPSKLYRLHLITEKGKQLRYAQRGGGTFNSLKDMQYRIEQMKRDGRKFEIYETETNWVKIDSSETDGFDPLRTDTLPFDQ